MKLTRLLAYSSCVFGLAGCDGLEPERTASETIERQITPETTKKMDYDRLVAELANRNSPPALSGDGPSGAPLFLKGFDWSEQDRVLNVLTKCTIHADDAWTALVEHLRDGTYCLTIQKEMHVSHDSIGAVCRMIVVTQLTELYMPYIPKYLDVYRKVAQPREVYQADLQEWCRQQQREGKLLFEMQIEMGEWALAKIAAMDAVPGEEREESCRQIQQRLNELRKHRKPVLAESIFGELRQPCTREGNE